MVNNDRGQIMVNNERENKRASLMIQNDKNE